MELTLGPILFEWKAGEVRDFYKEVADMDLDRVYLGEVICYKKRALTVPDILEIGRELEASGKEVFVSTLAVVSNEDEVELTRQTAALPFGLEANDMAAMNMVDEGRDIVAGPHITSYNIPSIEFLKGQGVRRVVFPVEMGRDSLAFDASGCGVDTEVFGHGKVPLAFSWRCYTSRAYSHSKEDCHHDCVRFPEGMDVTTLDKEPVFNINGTSMLSARTYTMVEYIDDLKEIGIGALRISPQYRDTAEVVDIYRGVIEGKMSGEEGFEALKGHVNGGFCNGWYAGRAGKDYVSFKEFRAQEEGKEAG